MTINKIQKYNQLSEMRTEIEHIFKAAKMVFEMDQMHVYYRKHCYWKAFLTLYMSSLLLQYLKKNQINKNKAIPLLAQKKYLW